MATEQLAVRHSGTLLASVAVAVVASGAVLAQADLPQQADPRARLSVYEHAQSGDDVLDPAAASRLVVDPASTRLLVVTAAGAHYVARTPSGELCLLRVPDEAAPTEVCVTDRFGADTTIGGVGSGQVRLVTAGASLPSPTEGWEPAGPDVWVRD